MNTPKKNSKQSKMSESNLMSELNLNPTPDPRNNNIYVPSILKDLKEDLKEQTLQPVLQSKKPCKYINQERNEKGKCVKKCLSNQVRDPITKRCRNIKDVNRTANKLRKVFKSQNQNNETKKNKIIIEKMDDTDIKALDQVMLTEAEAKSNEPKKKKKMQEYVINIMNKYDEKSQASNWLGNFDLIKILTKYYSKKFKKSCIFQLPRMSWYTYIYNDEKKNFDFTPMYITYTDFEKKEKTNEIFMIMQYIREIVLNISKCIREKGKNVSIAMIYSFQYIYDGNPSAHENMLIFKPYNNTLEWFEPHGHGFTINDKVSISNEVFFEYLKKSLIDDKTIDCKSIRFIKQYEVCPIGTVGLQEREGLSELPDLSNGGYCALWSVLIMKLSLKYPYKTVNTIVHNLLEQYKTQDELRYLMYAFSNEISDILLKHYKMPLNKIIEKLNRNEKVPIRLFKNTSTTSQYSKSD
jgi:hypothetical protein